MSTSLTREPRPRFLVTILKKVSSKFCGNFHNIRCSAFILQLHSGGEIMFKNQPDIPKDKALVETENSQNIVKIITKFRWHVSLSASPLHLNHPQPESKFRRDAVIDKARQCPRIVNTQGRAVSAAAARPSRVSVAGWIIFLTDKIRSAPPPGATTRARGQPPSSGIQKFSFMCVTLDGQRQGRFCSQIICSLSLTIFREYSKLSHKCFNKKWQNY